MSNRLIRLFDYIDTRLHYRSRLATILDVDVHKISSLYKELKTSSFYRETVSKMDCGFQLLSLNMFAFFRAPALYVICRVLEPECIVETGVADGFSSAAILKALDVNKKGKLYSIDLPNQPGQHLPAEKDTGWVIPDYLRGRWNLKLGASKDKLPGLLEDLGSIDIFYHDSDHSYDNMTFELNLAYDYVKRSGLLIADDVTENNAYKDFSLSRNVRNVALFKLGILRRVDRK